MKYLKKFKLFENATEQEIDNIFKILNSGNFELAFSLAQTLEVNLKDYKQKLDESFYQHFFNLLNNGDFDNALKVIKETEPNLKEYTNLYDSTCYNHYFQLPYPQNSELDFMFKGIWKFDRWDIHKYKNWYSNTPGILKIRNWDNLFDYAFNSLDAKYLVAYQTYLESSKFILVPYKHNYRTGKFDKLKLIIG